MRGTTDLEFSKRSMNTESVRGPPATGHAERNCIGAGEGYKLSVKQMSPTQMQILYIKQGER
jgi:hypothetical protein